MIYRFFFVSFLFLVSSSLHVAWTQATAGPRMVLKETSFDFGVVQEGERLVHEFHVRNQGDQVLEIKDVQPG